MWRQQMRSQHLLVSTKYFSLGTVAVENKTVREENVVGRPREALDKESNQGQICMPVEVRQYS